MIERHAGQPCADRAAGRHALTRTIPRVLSCTLLPVIVRVRVVKTKIRARAIFSELHEEATTKAKAVRMFCAAAVLTVERGQARPADQPMSEQAVARF